MADPPRPVARARRGRATLSTVAASAGVSVATVSKVLNGRADVAPATRALVQELLARHDYVGRHSKAAAKIRAVPPAPGARRPVELLFHDDLNAYGIEVVQGVIEAGAAAGVSVVVTRRPDRGVASARGTQWVADLVSGDRQAVISAMDDKLTVEDVDALSRANLPLVVIDPLKLHDAAITSVGSTNFAGGLTATRHLLSLGHRRIAYVGGPVAAACNQARVHGYRAAMEDAGAPILDGYIRTGDFLYDNGLRQGRELLALPEPPTAFFAGSDETALGVIEAARSLGLRVPEDLSVIGFDDTQVARLSSPQLTTIRQPLREMGAVALRTALRLAAGEELESHHVELATQLVERRSTGPIGVRSDPCDREGSAGPTPTKAT